MNELVFEPYNALDLHKILTIRVNKALNPNSVHKGVVEKISAISSRTHGDARKAVELLSKSARMAERSGTAVTLDIVDRAQEEIERDKYLAMIRTSPHQLQAALFAILASCGAKQETFFTGDAYQAYCTFCRKINLRALTQRAFSDLVSELDMYGFIQAQVRSRGRYGRTKEIVVHLPLDLVERIRQVVLMEFDLNPKPSMYSHR